MDGFCMSGMTTRIWDNLSVHVVIADGEEDGSLLVLPNEYDAVLLSDGKTQTTRKFAMQFMHLELPVIRAVLEQFDFLTCLRLQIGR